MSEAQGGRKRKRRGEAKASGSGNAKSVVKTAEERKTRSASREDAALAARPVKERKPVDRFVAGAPQPRKVRESMAFSIEQGPGTKLQDIPNVVFKLSRRKDDENIQVLHTILFGRKSNAYSWKKNILQFSGFVWAKNKEKERAKVKERLDECNKERLLVFRELLDIPDTKATTKKGEISAKLLEFLESPHVTRRDVVLAENVERGRKCKTIQESSQKASGETLPNIKNKKQKRSPGEEAKNFHPEEGSGIRIKQKVLPTKISSSTKSDKGPSKPVSEKTRLSTKDGQTSKKSELSPSKEPVRWGSKAYLKEKTVSVKTNSVKITKIKSKKSPAVNNSNCGQPSNSKPQRKGKKDDQNDEKPANKTSEKKAAKSASNVSARGKGVCFEIDLEHRKTEVDQILKELLTYKKDDEGDDQDSNAGREGAEGSGKDKQGDDAGGDAGGSGKDARE